VREQARALVIGDVVLAPEGEQRTPLDPERDHPDRVEDLIEWSGGEIRWQNGDLVVIAASYD
jgi:hypothetical protein